MGKIRVYNLSKKLGVSNKEIMNVARSLGIRIRSHSGSLASEEAERIKKKIKESKRYKALSNDLSFEGETD
jgi:translation initiation factor IF-2